MNRFIELSNNQYIGKTFGRLTIQKVVRDKLKKATYAVCSCECGTKSHLVRLYDLPSGHTQSCGCLRREIINSKRQSESLKRKTSI